MCNINHPKFPRFVRKMPKTKIKLFSVTFVNFGFILNVTTLIIQITGIFKTVMNPDIAQNLTAQFFLSIPYLVTKTFWLLVLTLIVTSRNGKIQKMIMIGLYHENLIQIQNFWQTSLTMLPPKIVMTLKKLSRLNIMTLMKCIALKYLTKINRFPYSM